MYNNDNIIKSYILKMYEKIKEKYLLKRVKDKEYSNLRITSIDFFRGMMVVFAMFFINQGLENELNVNHIISKWNGFTFADMQLPLFLIVMGMSIPFFVKKNYEDGETLLEIIKRSAIRTVILFAIGVIYSIIFLKGRSSVRITGPFQLIAINYFLCTIMYISFLKLRVKNNALTYVFLILAIVWSLIFTAIGFSSGIENINSNAFVVLDNAVIGKFLSNTLVDSEGILATISSLSFGMMGVSIACIINKKPVDKKYIHYKRTSRIRKYGFSKENLLHDIKSWINPGSLKAISSNYYRLNHDMKKVVNMFLLFLFTYSFSKLIEIWIPINRNIFSITLILRIVAYSYITMIILYVVCDMLKLRYFVNLISRIGQNALFVILFVTCIHNLLILIKLKSIYTNTWLHFNNWFTTDFILPITGIDTASAIYSVVITIIWIMIANVLEKFDLKINL